MLNAFFSSFCLKVVQKMIKKGKKTFLGGNIKPALRKVIAALNEFRSAHSELKKASGIRSNREKPKVSLLGASLMCSVKPSCWFHLR